MSAAPKAGSGRNRPGWFERAQLASLLHPSRVMLAIPGSSSVTHVEENRHGALVRLTDEHFAALSGAV
jgi:pyridoxine 4-dehydrogenase